MKAVAIEKYLVEHIDKLDYVVEDVVLRLPDSTFYDPEIQSEYFRKQRSNLKMLQSKMNSFAYRTDKNVRVTYNQELAIYEGMLKELAEKKRESLKQELLVAEDEAKVALLFLMIYNNNLLKQLKGTSQEFGELLKSNKFEEAFDIANKLNALLKDDQLNDFTGRELAEVGISEMQDELKKYWWANGEMRKYQGILRKRGGRFSELAN